MKISTLLFALLLAMTASAETVTTHPDEGAETIEPNLKWGKPTQQELTMTEYAPDPVIINVTDFMPPIPISSTSIVSTFHPLPSA